MERIAFVDLQGFLVEGEFILKELCFSMQLADDVTPSNQNRHFIFAAPFAWKFLNKSCRKQAGWLCANHHGFHWTAGSVSYERITECIQPLLENNLTIYVKGEHKVHWLKKLCSKTVDVELNCINIEKIGCSIQLNGESSSNNNIFHCGFHNITKSCGLRNVKVIQNWYNNNINK